MRPIATLPDGKQLTLLDQVRREEHDEQHLRGLARLNVSGRARPRAGRR